MVAEMVGHTPVPNAVDFMLTELIWVEKILTVLERSELEKIGQANVVDFGSAVCNVCNECAQI